MEVHSSNHFSIFFHFGYRINTHDLFPIASHKKNKLHFLELGYHSFQDVNSLIHSLRLNVEIQFVSLSA